MNDLNKTAQQIRTEYQDTYLRFVASGGDLALGARLSHLKKAHAIASESEKAVRSK